MMVLALKFGNEEIGNRQQIMKFSPELAGES
jgi:hypothetical protein